MDDIKILIPTNNNLNILFFNPKIESKTMLKFEKNTCGTESYYDFNTKKILIKIGSTDKSDYIHLKLNEYTINILDNIRNEEYSNIELFFNGLNSGNCELLINEDKTTVDMKILIDNYYNSYYCQLFMYFINTKFKQNLKDIESVQNFLLSKINYSKYSLEHIDNYGDFYIIPVKDIK